MKKYLNTWVRSQIILVFLFLQNNTFAGVDTEIQAYGILSSQQVLAGDYVLLGFEAKIKDDFSPEKIAYAEIINNKGNALVQIVFELHQGKGQAFLRIPNDLPSDYYLVRAYTKGSQLNFQNAGVFHQWLGIINPQQAPKRLPEVEKSNQSKSDSQIEILAEKNEFAPNETIKILIKSNSQEPLGITSSVTFPDITSSSDLNTHKITYPQEGFTTQFIPEIYGPIIKLRGGEKGYKKPLMISSSGNTNKFYAGKLDDNGELVLDLGKIGVMDFLTLQSSETGALDQVYLESSFWSVKPKVESWPEMIVTGDKLSAIRKVHTSRQLMDYFSPNPESKYSTVKLNPSRSYLLEEFNKFDNLWTVFREYIEEVLVRNQSGKSVLRIINKNTGYAFQNGPLILLDGLPILEVDALLKHSPANIKEIKIINQSYVNNGVEFDGVVQLFSHKGDLGEFPVPSDLLLLPFSGVQSILDYKDWVSSQAVDRVPNLKRLVYWDTELIQEGQHEYTIEFQVSELEGEYIFEISPMHSGFQYPKTSWRYTVKSN